MVFFGCPRAFLLIIMIMDKLKIISISLPSTASVVVRIEDYHFKFEDVLSCEAVYKLFERVNIVTGTFPESMDFVIKDGRLIMSHIDFIELPCVAYLKDCYLANKAPIYRFLRLMQNEAPKIKTKKLV